MSSDRGGKGGVGEGWARDERVEESKDLSELDNYLSKSAAAFIAFTRLL